MDKFSDILSDLIIENNCSLRELERRCGVASSQLSRYLKGTIPNVKVAMTLANYFECGLDYLFGLSDEKQNKFYANFDTYNFIKIYLDCLSKCNISHWKFAQKIGLNESCLRHWQAGESPNMSTLILIADNLGVSLDMFFEIKH